MVSGGAQTSIVHGSTERRQVVRAIARLGRLHIGGRTRIGRRQNLAGIEGFDEETANELQEACKRISRTAPETELETNKELGVDDFEDSCPARDLEMLRQVR
jgi:hypothetical protein